MKKNYFTHTKSTTDTRYCLEHDQTQTKWMGLSFVPTKKKYIFQNKSNYLGSSVCMRVRERTTMEIITKASDSNESENIGNVCPIYHNYSSDVLAYVNIKLLIISFSHHLIMVISAILGSWQNIGIFYKQIYHLKRVNKVLVLKSDSTNRN